MKLRKLLPLIGILIFIYLILKIGINNIISSFSGINFYFLIIAFLLSIINLFPPVIKWLLILRKQNIDLDFLTLFKLDLIGTFYGVITPGRVGTVIRVSYLKDKIKKHIGFCTTSVLLDKILDLIAIMIFALVGAFLLLHKISGLVLPITLLLFGLLFCIIFFSSKHRSRHILKIIHKFIIPKRYKKLMRETFHSFYDEFPKLRYLFVPLIIALVSYLLYYSLVYIVALSFSINIPYIYFVTLLSLATVVSLIPITVAGIGTREAVLVVLLGIFNVEAENNIEVDVNNELNAYWVVLSATAGAGTLEVHNVRIYISVTDYD